jgi:hypothetical protein
MAKKLLLAILRPSKYLKRISEDVSEGSKSKLIATRVILGFKVLFYQNGLRVIEGLKLTEQEQIDSEILRLAHASILINEPVGSKHTCYVDATKNPVEVILYDMPAEIFIRDSIQLIRNGELDYDFLLNEHIKATLELTNERDVKLFGR